MEKIAITLASALVLSVMAPAHAADQPQQARDAAQGSSEEPGRMHREDKASQPAPDASPSARSPLPAGRSTETTDPAQSQVGADPARSKAQRNPAVQAPADVIEATPPSADAHAEGARGPRGDDESRARAHVPEYEGPVQKPGESADPNVKSQERQREPR
ncbi:MAG TPA: hypothetical protein VFA81_07220 [Burkholderiales bacterium]|nr:hypothetical protein [Burkholderiales bacterium]